MEGSVRCPANYVPLSPISFLERAALVYADRPSVLHSGAAAAFTWKETRTRCLNLAAALAGLGISSGDVVAALVPNTPAMYELHFAVPISGGVLCALNTRHDSSMLAVLLRHSGAKVLFLDSQLLATGQAALAHLPIPPIVIIISDDDEHPVAGHHDYETLAKTPSPEFKIRWPADECDPISLNYTSGTTARPKGVIYSHRGAYLNAVAAVLLNEMPPAPVYLWTVPMFHCNGWCLTWSIAALGGTNVCLRNVSGEAVLRSIADHSVTHMAGSPTVLNMIVDASEKKKKMPAMKRRVVEVMTGAAPPPPAILSKMEELGFRVTHSYGLTETYGPATVCVWRPEWDSRSAEERARLKARQGVNHTGLEEVDVKDPATMESVPADGRSLGEVMFRGNTVMSGYFRDPGATSEALAGGWLRSGDLGVRHPDGYVELRDRAKDIVVSGGENVSTIEVESVISGHPAVTEAAVVGRPDEHWGETPCAFVKVRDGGGAGVDGEEIIRYCRERLPHYMAPRTIVFVDGELPKTSTGKIQKFVLRERARALGSIHKFGGSKL